MKTMNAKVLIIVLWIVLQANTTFAVWSLGDPNVMHFPQLPDISENGLVVLATPTPIADDFRSTQTTLITNFVLWGAWLNDQVGPLELNLAIFSNIPAGSNNIPYSRPGQLLWFHSVTEVEVEATGIAILDIPLYDASLNEAIGVASTIIQYDIKIIPDEAFLQQEDSIYWLAIARPNVDDGNIFGWMTSFNKFNASGVFEYTPLGGGQPEILQLLYPIIHQYVGQGIDLAFVTVNSTPTQNEGNFDGDWDVDLDDFAIFAAAWLTASGQEGWNSDCDISIPANNYIDIMDLAIFFEHWLDGK